MEIFKNICAMASPFLFLFISILIRRHGKMKLLLLQMAGDSAIASKKVRLRRKIAVLQAYSLESLKKLDNTELAFSAENLKSQLNINMLPYIAAPLQAKGNSKLVYFVFLKEITPILARANREVSTIIEKFDGVTDGGRDN